MNRVLPPLLLVLAAGCFPLVGPPVDRDGGGGDAGAGGGGGSTATCSDTLQNGTESDVDCGGTCPACGLGADCGSPLDCVSGVCTASRCVTPANACGAFAGCTSFVDLTAMATPTIRFPGGGNRYSPDCVRVRLGQSVVFSGGDFSSHTLEQGCGPVSSVIGASTGTSVTVTFDRALGAFGFYCMQHGSPTGSGMAGAIEVVR